MRTLILILTCVLLSGCGSEEKQETNSCWPNGNIFYYFSSEVSEKDKQLITSCLNKIEDRTRCIYFILEESEKSVKFEYSQDKTSWATKGLCFKNYIKLTTPLTKRNIYHETLHVLGLSHEHQRKDRNNNINIIYDNIDSENHKYFDCVQMLYDITEISYDTKSIMHYSPTAFSNSNNISIEFFNKQYYRSNEPTELDYKKIIAIYGE